MSRRFFLTVVLTATVIVLSSGATHAQLAWMDPVTLVPLPLGGSADLTLRVQGINDLWGVDFWVTYDPTQVILNSPIGEGVCPGADIPLANSVDNVAGVGHYAVSAFGSGPCDCVSNPDQVAAVFTFTSVTWELWSAIDFSLTDPPGVSVMANGSVEVCNESTPTCWQGAFVVPVELMSFTID